MAVNFFLTNVETLRARAAASIREGATISIYPGDVARSIELLQIVVATELVCTLRYSAHAIAVSGIHSESVSAEFLEHAEDERRHMMMAAGRIDQLGGIPNFDPQGLVMRSATEYGRAATLIDMVTENLVAERLVVDHYRELVKYFADDPTTRTLIEQFLTDEEDHANDMQNFLVAHHESRERYLDRALDEAL